MSDRKEHLIRNPWHRWHVDPRLGAGLLLLVLLWLAAAVPAVQDATRLVRERTAADRLGRAVDSAVVELQAERRLSAAYRAGGDTAALTAQRARTDRTRAELDAARQGWRGRLVTADGARSVDELRRRFDELGPVRARVDLGGAAPADVLAGFRRVIEAGLGAPWLPPAGGQAALGRAREALAEQDALLRTALAAPGRLTDADRLRVAELAGTRQARLSDAVAGPATVDPARYRRLTTVEGQVLLARGAPVTAADWAAAADPINAELREAEEAAARETSAATPGTVAAIVYAGLIAGVGLVAVIAVLVLARRAGKARTRRAPAGAAAPGDTGPALQPLLLDLHRRSQRLVHRQLRLLDAMERRQSDDETLGELFRVDHLANRVRRNVEKAISLTGGVPGRRWRQPMPLVEVVRGAVAEVDGYERVSTAEVEAAGLAGDAVTDVTHLLAELVENAVTNAPPESRVRVGGVRDADGGYTVTITDVGPGMSDLDLATARQVMSEPDPPGGGVWWGFYAVGRFAARQDITVQLGPGTAGGLLVAVTLPSGLLTDPEHAGAGPDAPSLDRVARMRARLGGLSDATSTTVDLPVVDTQRTM